jgi:hypothetical protein
MNLYPYENIFRFPQLTELFAGFMNYTKRRFIESDVIEDIEYIKICQFYITMANSAKY